MASLEDIEAQVFAKFGTLFEAKGKPDEIDAAFVEELFKEIPCPGGSSPPHVKPLSVKLTVTYGPRSLHGTPLYKTELTDEKKVFYTTEPPPFPQPGLSGCGELIGIPEGPATYGYASSEQYKGYTLLQIFNETSYLKIRTPIIDPVNLTRARGQITEIRVAQGWQGYMCKVMK